LTSKLLAVVMLAAVAVTKVEGAVFVAIAAFAYLITRKEAAQINSDPGCRLQFFS